MLMVKQWKHCWLVGNNFNAFCKYVKNGGGATLSLPPTKLMNLPHYAPGTLLDLVKQKIIGSLNIFKKLMLN